jgi:hypothetical protein
LISFQVPIPFVISMLFVFELLGDVLDWRG